MKKSFMRLVRGAVPFMAIAMVVVLSGCQTNNYAGSGPLSLSPRASDSLEKYLGKHNKGAFAISEDGLCTYYLYCPASSCLDRDEKYFAVQGCKSACKRTCGLLADGQRVIWNGPVKGLPEKVKRPQDE